MNLYCNRCEKETLTKPCEAPYECEATEVPAHGHCGECEGAIEHPETTEQS